MKQLIHLRPEELEPRLELQVICFDGGQDPTGGGGFDGGQDPTGGGGLL
jgi:hypothetical protein